MDFTFRPVSLDEFDVLLSKGLVDRKTEFVRGRVVIMPDEKNPHSQGSLHLNTAIARRLPENRFLCTGHVKVGDNRLVPDLAVLHTDGYDDIPDERHTLLVAEVSDSSLSLDLGKKKSDYAAAGYKELWILDVIGRVLNVYKHPVDGEFQESHQVRPSGTVVIPFDPDVSIPAALLF